MDNPYMYRDARQQGRPSVQRTNRSWTENGVQHNMRSYVGPNVVFQMQTSSSENRPQRSQGPGLLGAAVNLIGSALAANQQASQTRRTQNARESYAESANPGEEAHRDSGVSRRKPQSFVGAVAGKLFSAQEARQRPEQRSRGEIPTGQDSGRAGGSARPRAYQPEKQRRSRTGSQHAYVDDYSDGEDDDYDNDDYDFTEQPRPPRAFTADDASLIQSLETAIEHHERQKKRCQKLLESASRQPMVDSSVLQYLVNELKTHETAQRDAIDNLRMAKAGFTHDQGKERAQYHDYPQGQGHSSRSNAYQTFADEDDPFQSFFQPRRRATSYVSHGNARHNNPFAAFDQMFDMLQNVHSQHQHAFGNASSSGPYATFTFGNSSNSRPRAPAQTAAQPQHPSAFFTQPASPPTTLLKPEEAKRRFKTYNDRWNALPLTDPNIPYPTRSLTSSSLSARNTLWATDVSTVITDWSDELIMQANAQAFFLGVADLAPQYSDAGPTGRITMGYDKKKASAAQVKALVDVLKKEKSRWHSDRLGRRNGGEGGLNESLQADERARAVFHGVCELMEFATGS